MHLPRAVALLASCAASPPPTRLVRGDHGGFEEQYCSTAGPGGDRRVAELRRLHEAEWARILAAYDRGLASQADCRDHLRHDVQAAIRASIKTQYQEAAE